MQQRSSADLRPEADATGEGGSVIDLVLDAYQQRRPTPHRSSICNAPLTNLYLKADGRAAPCWLYFVDESPAWGPSTLREVWDHPHLESIRTNLAQHRFAGPCTTCEHNIRAGDQPLAAAYDNDRPIGEWPTMMEIELSNLCNLECVMCHGLLSSRIRKNREHLPPLEVPYDETFIEQFDEFLPHLHELRINGGEPLLQPLVHRLGERIGDLRPDLQITVATNGTVLNGKVRRLLERCTVHLNISIDSLVPERYESIRVNADFDKLMANVAFFREYCQANDRTLCIMVNPMRQNWTEMPAFVQWCNERHLPVWFNTIREPVDLALHSVGRSTLEQIVETWKAADLPAPRNDVEERNAYVFGMLVHQAETWRDEASAEGSAPQGTPVALRPRP